VARDGVIYQRAVLQSTSAPHNSPFGLTLQLCSSAVRAESVSRRTESFVQCFQFLAPLCNFFHGFWCESFQGVAGVVFELSDQKAR
jgi:hypothetical protein